MATQRTRHAPPGSAQAVADRLGVSLRTIYEWAARGDIPHIKVGPDSQPRYIFPAEVIDPWIAEKVLASVKQARRSTSAA